MEIQPHWEDNSDSVWILYLGQGSSLDWFLSPSYFHAALNINAGFNGNNALIFP